MKQWHGCYLLKIRETEGAELKDCWLKGQHSRCLLNIFLISPVYGLHCILFTSAALILEFSFCKHITNFSSTNSVFDGDKMEDMDSRWQRDCQRSPFESLKWQMCSARQSVLEQGKNQSHAKKQKKKKTLLGKDVSERFGHSFCNHFQSPGVTYSTLKIKREVLRII